MTVIVITIFTVSLSLSWPLWTLVKLGFIEIIYILRKLLWGLAVKVIGVIQITCWDLENAMVGGMSGLQRCLCPDPWNPCPHNLPWWRRLYCCCSVAESCLTLVTPWTAAHQAPLSMGFSRQEYWSGLPFPPPGNLPNPGIKPTSPALAGGCFTTELPGKPERDFSDVINIGLLTGKRRRRKQRLRWLDSVTDWMDVNLSKLQETVKDWGAGVLQSVGLLSQLRLSNWTTTVLRTHLGSLGSLSAPW